MLATIPNRWHEIGVTSAIAPFYPGLVRCEHTRGSMQAYALMRPILPPFEPFAVYADISAA